MESKKSIFKIALGIILGVLALAGMCSISGCGGGGGGNAVAEVPANYVPIDSNGEGLPLNVRKYIEDKHPESARKRAALFQDAKVTYMIATENDPAKTAQYKQEESKVLACLEYSLGVFEMEHEYKDVDAVVLNTRDLSRAYIAYQKRIGEYGEMISFSGDDGSACAVDPAALPN